MKSKFIRLSFGLLVLAVFYCIISLAISLNSNGSEEVEEAKKEYDIVMVDFWAEGCTACKLISPTIDEIEDEYPEIKVMKVDLHSEEGLGKKYSIIRIPTVVIYYKGDEFTRLVGRHEKEEYVFYIEALLHPEDESRMSKFEWDD